MLQTWKPMKQFLLNLLSVRRAPVDGLFSEKSEVVSSCSAEESCSAKGAAQLDVHEHVSASSVDSVLPVNTQLTEL
eukprot:c10735_g1_i1 orf=232-459(+)